MKQVKSLSDLNKLVPVTNNSSTIKSDEGILICLWKLMSDYKQRSINEIVFEMSKMSFTDTEIRNTFNTQLSLDWFGVIPFPHQNSRSFVYTLLKDIPMPIKDINNTITSQDTIDVAIWKLMSDFKFRTLKMVALTLSDYNFNSETVKNRFITLFKHNWFSRDERKNEVEYKLKKNISLPVPQKILNEPVIKNIINTEIKINVNDIKKGNEMIKDKSKVEKPMSMIIDSNEGLATCIWKVMCDHNPYSAEDVSLLLIEHGIKSTTIKSKLSELRIKSNWFHYDNKNGNFTLRNNIPMPINERPYRSINNRLYKGEPAKTSNGILLNSVDIVTSNISKDVPEKLNNFSNIIQPTSELIRFIVEIKGMIFTFEEATEITKTLIAAGFNSHRKDEVKSLVSIQSNVVIRGVSFTEDEAIDITEALIQANFVK